MEDFKFSTLEYKRPDFEKTGAFAEEITEKIKNAASYGELKGYMEQMEEMSKNFSTDCTIASIRHTLDTTDEFYEKEDAYINDMVPTVMPKLLAMNDGIKVPRRYRKRIWKTVFCTDGSAEKDIL